jgi:uncharacterized protein (DUF697 family)
MAAGVSMLPIPGLDWVTDISVLIKLLNEINQAFGLSEAQIASLGQDKRVLYYKAVAKTGNMLVGRVITQKLVIKILQTLGVRLTTQQIAKYVPLVGQLLSATLTYTALKKICEQHIQQCAQIHQTLTMLNNSSSGLTTRGP